VSSGRTRKPDDRRNSHEQFAEIVRSLIAINERLGQEMVAVLRVLAKARAQGRSIEACYHGP
jgi:hypothetical protein